MTNKWEPIVLSARAFGHLSQGLYRTPAGAIKELISNSFDADADLVRIHTDFPRFMTFWCEDRGSGMPLSEFQRLVNRGIGESFKRTGAERDTTAKGRSYIGRLGLGILALAQICTEFDIVSHHRASRRAFEATIQFLPYTREEMDKLAARAQTTGQSVHGGQYTAKEIPYDPGRPALRIFTKYLRETFQRRMRNLGTFGNKKSSRRGDTYEPYATFEDFLGAIYPRNGLLASLNLRSDYDQLLFGLALAPPLPFVAKHNIAVHLPRIADRQAELEHFGFKVEVDNISLAHPVCLPSDGDHTKASDCSFGKPKRRVFVMKDGASEHQCDVIQRSVKVKGSDIGLNLYDFGHESKVAGKKLAFSGYLFQQTGRLYPRDIQGVLIRINNVAIGKYDNSLLTYPWAEGPRFAMVSSELFIEAGFEDGLNIDRDSFNELHPHYVRVQAYLHSFLHELIFPETWKEEKTRNRQRREVALAARQTRFSKSFRAATGDNLGRISRIETQPRSDPDRALRESPVEFAQGSLSIDQQHPVLDELRRRKKNLPLIEKLLIAFERANLESSANKRRELFYRLLIDIFKDAQ